MSEIVKITEYFAAVSGRTRSVLDGNSGKKYALRPLYFNQRLNQGRYAFMNYADLCDKANDSMEQIDALPVGLGREIKHAIAARLKDVSATDTMRLPASIEGAFPELTHEPVRTNCASTKKTKDESDHVTNNVTDDEYLGFAKGLQKMISNAVNNRHSAGLDEKRHDERDLLKYDSPEQCKTLIYAEEVESRVILFAGAGYGKSTLMQRIALAYSPCDEDTAEDRKIDGEFRATIGDKESVKLVPCMIELRDCMDRVDSLEMCISGAVAKALGEQDAELVDWLIGLDNRLLLLIDGLDELTTERAVLFLQTLEKFLQKNREVRVILTSRIAGVDDERIEELLKRMRFHGRTIMPLNDQETQLFCEQWIKVTNDSTDLLGSLERIRTEAHLGYLREFMRKPLELVMLLHYIPKQSFSTFNRWELFYNVLWAEITNHIAFEDKQLIFDDECKLLGYIAYKMQLKDRMSLSFKELAEMIPEVQGLTFYSDLFANEENVDSITAENLWRHLKELAQSIGIIETVDGACSVTIPIRSYQEFLTAYACCNLCLIDNEFSPDPQKILLPHINEASWVGVLGFSIAGMEYSSYSELDDFLSELYENTDNVSGLCNLMDTDYFNSRVVARALCKIHFSSVALDNEKKRLIMKCMTTKSASSFRLALASLYKKSIEEGTVEYLEALAYSHITDCLNRGDDLIYYAKQLLESKSLNEQIVAAELFVIISRVLLGEEAIKKEDIIINEVEEAAISALHQHAKNTHFYIFTQALSELWISKIPGYENIKKYLDVEMLNIACSKMLDEAKGLFDRLKKSRLFDVNYVCYLKSLINMIGAFPYELSIDRVIETNDLWLVSLIDAYYEVARDDADYDQVGIAVCKFHLCGNLEELIYRWVEDVCKGRPSSQVRKDHLSARENNHFKMVCESIVEYEKEYFVKREALLNTFDFKMVCESNVEYEKEDFIKREDLLNIFDLTIGQSPVQLFSKGQDSEALKCAVAQYKTGNLISDNNMAFLVRYLKYDPEEEFGMPRFKFIQKLLKRGVASRESYSVMNYALALLEEGRTEEAGHLIDELEDVDIQMITDTFWYPEMWQKRKTPEGALVCLIAQKRGDKVYAEQADMLEWILENQPQWARLI